jgi:hypothetical protein
MRSLVIILVGALAVSIVGGCSDSTPKTPMPPAEDSNKDGKQEKVKRPPPP